MPESVTPFDIYANGIQVAAGVWDFVLDLYLRSPSPDTEPRLLGRVRMSPQHALVTAQMLQRQVDFYQENIGPIVLPERLISELGLKEVHGADR